LQALKKFRDRFGAHSEHGAALESLPSVDEFEELFEFADSFYRLVSDALLDVGPALIGAQVAIGTLRVMKRLGIQKPRIDFEPK
jgi:hypothetical protein